MSPTTPGREPVTLRQLQRTPGMPLPVVYGGGEYYSTQPLGEAHARRLTLWCAMTSFPDETTVEITGHVGGPTHSTLTHHTAGCERMAPPRHHLGDELGMIGWSLNLRRWRDAPPVMILFSFEGYVRYSGTPGQQAGAFDEASERQSAAIRAGRADRGYGPSDAVSAAANALHRARLTVELCTGEWQAAVAAGWRAGLEAAALAQLSKTDVSGVMALRPADVAQGQAVSRRAPGQGDARITAEHAAVFAELLRVALGSEIAPEAVMRERYSDLDRAAERIEALAHDEHPGAYGASAWSVAAAHLRAAARAPGAGGRGRHLSAALSEAHLAAQTASLTAPLVALA